MILILQWLAVPAVRAIVVAIGAFAIGALWLSRHDAKVEAHAEAKVIERSKEAGKKANAKARKAHDAARTPGAVDRVRSKFCVDCR